MSYLLDTNACVQHLRSRAGTAVTQKLEAIPPADVRLCSVVKAELIYGALRSREVEKNLTAVRRFCEPFASLPFDDRAAEAYGTIRAELDRHGTPIGPNDLMISAIAVANDATLVTHNTGEFNRVPGLKVEDWEIAP